MFGFSTSVSDCTDSIDGTELLKQVTMYNIKKFDDVIAENKFKIKMPEPPPLYYGLGPQLKEIGSNHQFKQQLPHIDGYAITQNLSQKPNFICQCSCQFLGYQQILKNILNTKESFLTYISDSGNQNNQETNLLFESRFESGNLFSASRIKTCYSDTDQILENYKRFEIQTRANQVTLDGVNRKNTIFQPWDQVYQLIIQSDSNSTSHSQWFYFTIDNVIPGLQYTFIISNFVKKKSSYNNGMQILFSNNNLTWEHSGFNIYYGQNSQYIDDKTNILYKYSSLFFQFTAKQGGKYIVAQHYPYTYTQQQSKINQIIQNYSMLQPDYLLMHKVIQKSIQQNDIDMLTITAKETENSLPIKQRKIIFVTSRIHPGETQASYILDGFLDYILSNNQNAIEVRNNFIIKIVPMLNPDGVILGNYRCNFAGCDLNRKWNNSSQSLTPCIYAVHSVLQEIIDQGGQIQLYLDIHGHFKKSNMFAYSISPCGYFAGLQQKSQLFNYSDCNFGISRGKENTGRVVTQKKYLIPYSFCIECSFHRNLKSQSIITEINSDSSCFQDDFAVEKNKQHKENNQIQEPKQVNQVILTQLILRQGGAELAEHLVYFIDNYFDEIYNVEQLNIKQPGFSDSDDSDEDIDVFKQFKTKKKMDSKLFQTMMKKQMGYQPAKKQKITSLVKKDAIVKSTVKLEIKSNHVHVPSFQRQSQNIQSTPNLPKNQEKTKVTAEQQQKAINNLVYRKNLPPRPVSENSVRIVYNKNIDLQKEKLAFEKQFYRPKVPVGIQIQPTTQARTNNRVSSISQLQSFGMDSAKRAKDLKPSLDQVIKK